MAFPDATVLLTDYSTVGQVLRVVVDPTTSTVVWQWSGSGKYHLLRPDGIDFRPS
jgi:hypothetical protein